MPTGPNGEERPAGAIANAVLSMSTATGDAEEAYVSQGKRKGGFAGAKARSENLTSDERSRIVRKAAEARWPAKRECQ